MTHLEGHQVTGSVVGQVDASVVPRFSGIRTFARLPGIRDVQDPQIAILGAPFDGGTTFRSGSRFGPAGVRECSLLLRPYNEALGTSPFDDVQVCDAGDAWPNPVNIEEAHNAIEASAAALHERGCRVIGLGGDHSVSLPLLKAAATRFGTLSLIQFDAHTDTWDSYFGAPLTHGTMFRRAAEMGIIDPGTSIQVGLRGSLYSENDMRENGDLGFRTIMAREVSALGMDGVLERIASAIGDHIYVSLDIDALDPAFAPGTGTPEVGGLSSRELLDLLRGIQSLEADLVSADVVEVSPPYDVGGVTALAGANFAYELLSLIAISLQRHQAR